MRKLLELRLPNELVCRTGGGGHQACIVSANMPVRVGEHADDAWWDDDEGLVYVRTISGELLAWPIEQVMALRFAPPPPQPMQAIPPPPPSTDPEPARARVRGPRRNP